MQIMLERTKTNRTDYAPYYYKINERKLGTKKYHFLSSSCNKASLVFVVRSESEALGIDLLADNKISSMFGKMIAPRRLWSCAQTEILQGNKFTKIMVGHQAAA